MSERVCATCGKGNPLKHQDFCTNLNCSGRMVLKTRPGVEYITSLPADEACVGIINFKGDVLVATSKGVYKLENNELRPIKFVTESE